jgi:hypothetical protein
MATRSQAWPATVVLLFVGSISTTVWFQSERQAVRHALWAEVQPVTIPGCDLRRFGEDHDGGYLLCANWLDAVTAGYSYGINGYDGWGCAVAAAIGRPVHQYDCFNTTVPPCDSPTVFHAECVGPRTETLEGRPFRSLTEHLAINGHTGRRVVVKVDIEGAEWDILLAASDGVLQQIDQLILEFHGVTEPKYVDGVKRLKEHFHVANLHMNNFSCANGLAPFPAWAYEVLFVNKRLAVAGAPRATAFAAADRPNLPTAPDCQSAVAP